MKTTQILTSLAIGAMVFAAGKIQASNSVVKKLSISGTFSYQTSSYSSPVETSKIVTESFNNKNIIKLLNDSYAFTNALGEAIPANAYLVLIGDNVYATNKAGFSANLSTNYYSSTYEGYFTPIDVTQSEGYEVYSGKYNYTTYAVSEQGLQAYSYIDINDGMDNTITVEGLAKYSYSASKVSSSGVQKISDSGSITGSGDGYIQGDEGVVQAKGSASGSGSVTVEE
jgi:hypothetical protein